MSDHEGRSSSDTQTTSDDYATLAPPPPSYASLTTPLVPAYPAIRSSSSSHGFVRNNPAFEHSMESLGMPSGYFLLRNHSTRKRTFDVRGRATADGSEICLHPVKQPYVPRGSNSLQNSYNNQVLYLSWTGHLQTASADGRAIDCIDGNLVLAIPKPIFAIPSRESHPLPKFRLDPETSTLHVLFDYDPTFPGPNSISTAWQQDDFIVESVPSKRRKEDPSVWATASSGLLSGFEKFANLARGVGGNGKEPQSSGTVTSSSMNFSSSRNNDNLEEEGAQDNLPPPPPKRGPWDQARSPGSQVVFEQQGPPLPTSSSQSSTSYGPTSYTPYRPSYVQHNSDSPLPALPPPSPSSSPFPASQASSQENPPPPTRHARTSSLPNHQRNPSIPKSNHPQRSATSEDDETDSDGDTEAYRPLRVIRLSPGWREKFPRELLTSSVLGNSSTHLGVEGSSPKVIRRWKRRQWDVVPVVVKPVETPGGGPILPLLPRTGIMSGNLPTVNLPQVNFPSVLGGSLQGQPQTERRVPRPLNLAPDSPEQRRRDDIISPPLPDVPVEDEESEVGDEDRTREGTPMTGESWADATILRPDAIANLASISGDPSASPSPEVQLTNSSAPQSMKESTIEADPTTPTETSAAVSALEELSAPTTLPRFALQPEQEEVVPRTNLDGERSLA
ncbi:hypothetical protein T439DRAFT_347747 [Meredithblackwellia eburnea MCA 4105]